LSIHEIAFKYCNEEYDEGMKDKDQPKPVNHVVLIGDAAPNTKAEVSEKRSDTNYGFGESYWANSGRWSRKTHYQEELNALTQKKIVLDAFYVTKRPEDSFKEMATQTGGKAMYLDVSSDNGATLLTDYLCEQILVRGGGDSGQALVDEYRSMFKAGHTA
jgi:hypothetical protein